MYSGHRFCDERDGVPQAVSIAAFAFKLNQLCKSQLREAFEQSPHLHALTWCFPGITIDKGTKADSWLYIHSFKMVMTPNR